MAAVVLRTKICLFKYVHLYISMHASIHNFSSQCLDKSIRYL